MAVLEETLDPPLVAPPIPSADAGSRVRIGVRVGLLLGSTGMQVAAQVVTILLLRFLTDSLAVAAGLAATIFAFTKIYDGLIDPAIGVMSDSTRTRLGRRLPYMLLGTVLLPLSIVGIFNVPQLPSTAETSAIIALALLFYATAHTIWAVPFVAMSVELSPHYHERSVLMAYRAYGSSIGIMLGSAIAPWLLASWGRTAEGHSSMSFVVGMVIFTVLGTAVLLLRSAKFTLPSQTDPRLFHQLATAWKNRPFRILALTQISLIFGVACSASSNAYFSRDVLRASDVWLGTFYIVLLLGTLVATPLWLHVSKRFDKKGAYILSLVLYAALNLSWILASPEEPYALRVARVFLIGASMGGVILLSYSTLSDAIRLDFLQSGLRREGAFAGAISLIDKVASALGVACMGWILSFVGYVSTSTGGEQEKSAEVIWGLYLSFAIIPAATAFIGALLLLGYRLTQSDLEGEGAR